MGLRVGAVGMSQTAALRAIDLRLAAMGVPEGWYPRPPALPAALGVGGYGGLFSTGVDRTSLPPTLADLDTTRRTYTALEDRYTFFF